MVHGTADDNVHYQQSMMFSRALEEADVLFKSVEKYFLKHFYNQIFLFLQATKLPRRGSRPGWTETPFLPHPHWLPHQRLLREERGGARVERLRSGRNLLSLYLRMSLSKRCDAIESRVKIQRTVLVWGLSRYQYFTVWRFVFSPGWTMTSEETFNNIIKRSLHWVSIYV